MKRVFNTLLLLLSTTVLLAQGWTSMPDFTALPRFGGVGIGVGDKGYIGLGADDVQIRADWWEFDPVQKTWTQVADFPGTARVAAVAFAIGNKAYVGTGLNMYTVYADFFEYNPANNTWTRKADYAGGPRYGAMAFNIDTKGYIGCGKDQGLYDGNNDFWEYDPVADNWTRKADAGPVHRSFGAAFNAGNKGYIGLGAEGYDTRKKDLWEFDPAANTWLQKADFPGTERMIPCSFGLGNKGYAGMGYYYSPLSDFWEFDPSLNRWTQKEDNLPRGQGMSFSIGNKGYAGFGYNQTGNLKDFWEYSAACSLTVCIPDVYTVNPGGEKNTIYLGYGSPYLTLEALPACDNVQPQGNYSFLWSDGSEGPVIVVNPAVPGTYDYTVTVTDDNGCIATASITVTVVDIRCGNNKVMVCHIPPGNPFAGHTLCISKSAVPALLRNGSMLGTCEPATPAGRNVLNTAETEEPDTAVLQIFPNPNSGSFRLKLPAGNNGALKLVITDARGVIVKTIHIPAGKAQSVIQVTMGSVAQGLYFIRVSGKQSVYTAKFVVW